MFLRRGLKMNELKVFYDGERGLMTFDNKKTIFQHREFKENVEKGLGIIVEDTVWDKGNYAFAVFQNVATVVPKDYFDIRFFVNRGVPVKVTKGFYGKNVLLKEEYKDRVYIRAYKEDGTIGLYESQNIVKENYSGPNVYFNRLEDIIKDCVDITEELEKGIFESIKSLHCDYGFENETVFNALKGLNHNTIYKLDSGVIIADGKFESLIIWSEGTEVKMAWLGRKIDLTGYTFEDITSDLIAKKRELRETEEK